MPSKSSEHPSLTSIANSIFASIAANNHVTDEQLASLHFLFDKHFAKAVQIVDHSGVFSFEGERSRRRVFQVQGHRQGDRYTVIPGHFCSCQNFYFDVVSKNEATYCKHQLAAQLSEALGQTRNTVVGDLVVAEILQSQ